MLVNIKVTGGLNIESGQIDPKATQGLNQISMTKLKSRYKHEHFRRCCALRACAGLYFERLSLKKHINYFKLGVNEHVKTTTFP